jgi:acyl carrier protein
MSETAPGGALQDVIEEVRAFLRENFMLDAAVPLAADDSFMDNHILDSTGFIELIGFIEERFGLAVGDEEMVPENFDSLANIAAYVTRKRAGGAGR